MERDEYRKFENIDALIMAAEVLEREESIAKRQLASHDNHEIQNCFIFDSYSSEVVIEKCLHSHSSKENDIMEGIGVMKELNGKKSWHRAYKADNRMWYRDLGYLKKKLKGIKSKAIRRTFITEQQEDEDTSTASEDEGYNKYYSTNSNNDGDDITDDASECEEVTKISHKEKRLKRRSPSHNTKSRIVGAKTRAPMDKLSNVQFDTSGATHRTYKYSPATTTRSSTPRGHSMTLSQRQQHSNVSRTTVSLLHLHPPPDYKVPLKVHRPVDA